MPSSASSEASAWPVFSFSPDGMIWGPIRPVSGFSVAMTSPVSKACLFGQMADRGRHGQPLG